LNRDVRHRISSFFTVTSVMALLTSLVAVSAVFTEVNALPLDEESVGHHAPIGSAVRSPILSLSTNITSLASRAPDGGRL
jgi:hypothetical protein